MVEIVPPHPTLSPEGEENVRDAPLDKLILELTARRRGWQMLTTARRRGRAHDAV